MDRRIFLRTAGKLRRGEISMKVLVAIPTYNEKDNIRRMIDSVLSINETIKKANHSVNLLIIDDNSPDGTGRIVKEYQSLQKQGYLRIKDNESKYTEDAETVRDREIAKDIEAAAEDTESGAAERDSIGNNTGKSVFLIEREKKLGLGTAYAAAFSFAINKGYDYVLTMDCDFSHNPEEIAGFIGLMESEKCGMIVGSRYSGGIRIINWSMKRLLISYFANIYAKLITGIEITDLTGGFNMYDVRCLKNINLGGISSRGYAFQIEMKYRMVKESGCSFKEYPIIFYERTSGKSKISNGIILEAFFGVIKLRLRLFK